MLPIFLDESNFLVLVRDAADAEPYTGRMDGKLVKERREDNFTVAEWQSGSPLAVAGFNYGSYKKKQVHDDTTRYDVEAYATSELPDYLRKPLDSAT